MDEPSSVSRPDIDWDWLALLASEMESIIEDGHWNRREYERILRLARKAAAGNDSFCEFVLNREPSR